MAFTSRDELGEAMTVLMAKGGLDAFPSIVPRTEKNIILLSSLDTDWLVEYLVVREWATKSMDEDEGGKWRESFEARVKVLESFNKGDGEVVDDALASLLGRRPERGVDGEERLIRANPECRLHQNHVMRFWGTKCSCCDDSLCYS